MDTTQVPSLSECVGLDFETYSDIDLRTQGLDNYTRGKHFQVLIAGLATYDMQLDLMSVNHIDFVRHPYDVGIEALRKFIDGKFIVAHNAAFEREVLKALGINLPLSVFIDTAALTRAAGYASNLQNAAMQLLNASKHPQGEALVKQFCMPSKDQLEHNRLTFEGDLTHRITDWIQFAEYCRQDALLCLKIAQKLLPRISFSELEYSRLTMEMNEVGWPVDMGLVKIMNQMYKNNLEDTVNYFRRDFDEPDLNFNSTQQLIAWCKERGVTVKSFDEKHVEGLIKRVENRLAGMADDDPRRANLFAVLELAYTKRAIGGSSLKKLDVIERMTGPDMRLRDQYMHIGAAATYRTSGRGVQMQNLKRLFGEGDDVNELKTYAPVPWSNDQLASNLRQVFCASDTQGQLIVGDFSSVESRGLAWQAGEGWKLDAYFRGEDLYSVQAGQMLGIPLASVGKTERQLGKVAELSCGYGAGPGAVQAFAEKMGTKLSEAEATKLVRDWRDANPAIVDYWSRLDTALHRAIEHGLSIVHLQRGVTVQFTRVPAPDTLSNQVGQPMYSLAITMHASVRIHVSRVIHGVYLDGRNLCYYKPSERKSGDLWLKDFVDPKTKQRKKYSIYGGKLAGLLTQSLCREVFFSSLMRAHNMLENISNAEIIGQFHDEIVIDWRPSPTGHQLQDVKQVLQHAMTTCDLSQFPLAADIKSAYRYIK